MTSIWQVNTFSNWSLFLGIYFFTSANNVRRQQLFLKTLLFEALVVIGLFRSFQLVIAIAP